mgnify:CR=1 FL=1|jgi:undecaprenyl-diphosphatase
MNTIDQSVNIFFHSIQSPGLTYSFYVFTWFFNTIPAILLIGLVAYFLYKWKGKKNTAEFLIAIMSSFVFVWVVKLFINHPRPEFGIITAYGPSFPSAHAAVATTFFVFFLRFMRKEKNTFRKVVHQSFCILTPFCVGMSRLYLGVHWLSDVLMGVLVGLGSLYVAHKVVKRVI